MYDNDSRNAHQKTRSSQRVVPISHPLASVKSQLENGSLKLGMSQNRRPRPLVEVVPPSQAEQFSARNAVWLFIRDPQKFTDQEQEQLALIRAASAPAETAYGLVQDFLTMVHQREGERLDAWIEAAQASQIPELQHFVNGILKDKDAVVAGLTLPYSNGPVEAQVQKLKVVKRSMFGRAKLPLLRQRLLNTI